MRFLVRQGGRVGQRLTHVLRFQIGILTDDLFGGHAIGHEIDHQANRDSEAANTGAAA